MAKAISALLRSSSPRDAPIFSSRSLVAPPAASPSASSIATASSSLIWPTRTEILSSSVSWTVASG